MQHPFLRNYDPRAYRLRFRPGRFGYGRPFYGGFGRPFYGGFGYGAPFLGGVLGGLLGSAIIARPYYYPPYYGYPPYYYPYY